MVNDTAKKSPSQIFFKFGMWILHLLLITIKFVLHKSTKNFLRYASLKIVTFLPNL